MILITGLDGSGKSTLLEQIESRSKESAILRVPNIDETLFKADQNLFNASVLLNHLGKRADETKQPSFKIISMFGSMLIYSELLSFLSKNGHKIIAERHPLIDTPIYASAYLKVMDPRFLDLSTAKQIEQLYYIELKYIERLMPSDYQSKDTGIIYSLLEYLFKWFGDQRKVNLASLSELYGVDLPTEIIFLDAPASILVSRLKARESKEYHETEEQLTQMRKVYLNWFESQNIPVMIHDSTTWESNKILLEKVLS